MSRNRRTRDRSCEVCGKLTNSRIYIVLYIQIFLKAWIDAHKYLDSFDIVSTRDDNKNPYSLKERIDILVQGLAEKQLEIIEDFD